MGLTPDGGNLTDVDVIEGSLVCSFEQAQNGETPKNDIKQMFLAAAPFTYHILSSKGDVGPCNPGEESDFEQQTNVRIVNRPFIIRPGSKFWKST